MRGPEERGDDWAPRGGGDRLTAVLAELEAAHEPEHGRPRARGAAERGQEAERAAAPGSGGSALELDADAGELLVGRHRPAPAWVSVPSTLRSPRLDVPRGAVRGLLLLAVAVVLVLGVRWWWASQGAASVPVSGRSVSPSSGTEVEPSGAATSGHSGEGGAVGGADPPAEGRGTGGEEGTGSEEGTAHGGTGVAATPIVPAAAGAPADAARPAAGSPSAGAQELIVDVAGEVRSPGVVHLPAGSRVIDALEAAGGPTRRADTGSLNLARPLVDGEQVRVGRPGDPAQVEAPGAGPGTPGAPGAGGAAAAGGAAGSAPGTGAAGTAAGGAPSAPVDLNAADLTALDALPGVGPVTAQQILAWRDQNGRFSAVEELMEIDGIGEKTFARLQPLVTVG